MWGLLGVHSPLEASLLLLGSFVALQGTFKRTHPERQALLSSPLRRRPGRFRLPSRCHLPSSPTVSRFCAFTVFKLFMHMSYAALVDDVCTAHPDGTWNPVAAWNLASNPRGIPAAEPAPAEEEEEEKKKKNEMKTKKNSSLLGRKYAGLSPRTRFVASRVAHALLVLVPAHEALMYALRLTPVDLGTLAPPRPVFLLPRLHLLFGGDAAVVREAVTRAWVVALYTFPTALKMSAAHDGWAAVHVGLGLSRPHEWPPLFSGVAAATSVRRYWGRAWHRLFSDPAVRWARLAAAEMGLARPSLAYALFVPGSIFAVSAVMHALVELMLGECAWRAPAALMLLNFAAVVAEQAFQALVAALAGRRLWERRPRLCAWLGRLWLFVFMLETLPLAQREEAVCYARRWARSSV